MRAPLGEIPALIIDDEADQASVNTKDPRKRPSKEEKERTAINREIANLLRELPRCQYIAYTATPFANVLVDPADPEDIFPKDFIISLEPPAAYMGGRDFHDLDRDPDATGDELSFSESNERAYVRALHADPANEDLRNQEIRGALDAYVLSGALKLYRSFAGFAGDYRHHTMLVHESIKTADHSDLADTFREVWGRAGFDEPLGLLRLEELYETDFLPVTQARAKDAPMPGSFADLKPFIGEAVGRIRSGLSPIIVVNGVAEKEYTQDGLDFQRGDVWKILVGGAKLSRGFTVEGLTVTYYTRRTQAADSLMQMGRWFGYRPGYRDLVRLYIGRSVPGPRKTRFDLYEAFESIIRDEEDFRSQLRHYRGTDEQGRPKVRPIDVPPLVFQSLPWLKPTGRNKMFNATLRQQGKGGKVQDFFQQPPRSEVVNSAHFDAVKLLLDIANKSGKFFDLTDWHRRDPRYSNGGKPKVWNARYGIASVEDVEEALRQFRWASNFSFEPTLSFLQQARAEGTLEDWAIIVPELSGSSERVATRSVDGYQLDILTRNRRSDRQHTFSGSSPRQRSALEAISGGYSLSYSPIRPTLDRALSLEEFHHIRDELISPAGTRGALLLTFAADDGRGTAPRDLPMKVPASSVATLFSLALPYHSAPAGRIAFSVQIGERGGDAPATIEHAAEQNGL